MQLEYLAFTAGVLTFFSPCALAMFPSYIAYLLKGKKSLKQGAVAGFLVGMGGSLVFILAGALSGPLIDYLLALNPLIKTFLGILLLVLGFIMLLRLEFRIPLPLPSITPRGSFYLFSLIYGVVYALTALSCSLPVFLMILFNARWSPIIYLIYSWTQFTFKNHFWASIFLTINFIS